ncbi:DUF475 domain-containing protein [Blattabacterium cuenoti]|uniref:DUF475 domain-containing protein n=1 Tax=Blattabacterium cuenoti TaxID=1653831 RepID=UPI00163D0F64|nr:DUF475 domain-containing protein [Blattabacterium cuenoti]
MNIFIKSIVEIIHNPISSISIIGNLFLIESILSMDNAAMLASMITRLKKEERKKAIKYGIIGAYFFRGICLIFASILVKIWWLKFLGGIYLIFVGFNFFFTKKNDSFFKDEKNFNKKNYFWKIIFLIEIMDLTFSIDNIFASVALSNNFLLIFLGVFIGILSMRLISQFLIKLIEKYPTLENTAFIAIIFLGIKLIFSFFEKKYNLQNYYNKLFFNNLFSLFILSLFIFPIFYSWLSLKKNKN